MYDENGIYAFGAEHPDPDIFEHGQAVAANELAAIEIDAAVLMLEARGDLATASKLKILYRCTPA